MKKHNKKPVHYFLLTCVFMGGALTSLYAKAADNFPTTTLTMVVPYPPGGPTDVVSRSVAIAMNETAAKPVIVDNKPGASGMIGSAYVARSKADGYTFLANASIHIINPHVYQNVAFDATDDFIPITQLAAVPLVLVVPKTSPIQSVKELVDLAKNSKNGLNFGSAGTASAQHLSSEFLKQTADFEALHIPYKGSSPALTDLAGGQLDFMFDSLPSAMPFIQSGQLRAIAVSTKDRVAVLPDIPTVAESGYPEFETSTWYELWAPKATPIPIVEKIASFAQEALKKPEVIAQYKAIGAEPIGSSPTEFAAYAAAEGSKWGQLIEKAGIPKQ